MFKNYLKIIIRNIAGHKIYSFINILGLGIGLACCLVITLFVYQELTYDRHYQNAERIFRVGRVMRDGGGDPGNSLLAAPLLKQDFTEIQETARFQSRAFSVTRGQVEFLESGLGFADSSFFAIFDFKWLAGNPATALNDPAGIVLTRSLADKYFGAEDPLGQTLLLDGTYSVQVTGLIDDLPPNTHLRAEAFASIALLEAIFRDAGTDINVWNFSGTQTYVMLRENVAMESLEGQFTNFVNRHIPAGTTQIRGMFATDIRDIHMSESRGLTIGNWAKVIIFSAIASCILLIAAINFINLSMARSFWRAREVGIRKAVGANSTQIVHQFLAESMLMTMVAMLLAVGLVEVFLPAINLTINQQLAFSYVARPDFLIGVIFFTLGLGAIVGYYPARRMSACQLSASINGEHSRGRSGTLLRNGLVVLQFTISIALIVSATVVFLQMKIARTMDLGFDKEQIVVFPFPAAEKLDVNNSWAGLKSKLLSHTGIRSVTHSLTTPLQPSTLEIELSNDDGSIEKEFVMMQIEPDYFATYDINLLAGRYFSADIASDRSGFDPRNPDSVQGSAILSEQTAKEFGWAPADAIGQIVKTGSRGSLAVIGVVADTVPSIKTGSSANFYVVPDVFNYGFARGVVSVKIAGRNVVDTLEHIDVTWNQFVPGEAINRYFLDSEVRALYQQEQIHMRLFTNSALLAVLVACFGLYGLAAFNAERRTKEIGVRKVMGGSVWSIVLLLTNDFSKLVLLSNLIAWPVAYFAMSRWLENFAYRIDLTPLIFIGSGLIAFCIAWVTVGGTAAKAASAKPVLALRYE